MCFQQATGVAADSDLKYIEMRDNIMNIASQRISMISPTPMDIDAVNQQGGDEGGDIWNFGPPGISWEEPQMNQYQPAYDIDSVVKGGGKGFGKGKGKGDGSCHICGQFGFWSRECPSNPKGGGKVKRVW